MKHKPAPFERRWISTAAAAAYLEIHYQTAADYARRGIIPSVRIGSARRIDKYALDAMLEAKAGQR